MTNYNNIEGICNDHAKERLEEFQKTFNPSVLKVKDFVKTQIIVSEDGKIEHMWVQIDSIYKNHIIGKLDNTPFYENPIVNLGDKIKVKFKDISAIYN